MCLIISFLLFFSVLPRVLFLSEVGPLQSYLLSCFPSFNLFCSLKDFLDLIFSFFLGMFYLWKFLILKFFSHFFNKSIPFSKISSL